MKFFKSLLLLLFSGIQFCQAQDTTVLLSPAMFKNNIEEVAFSWNNGWFFREGNDTAWANKDADMSNWKRLKPIDLIGKLADNNGRLEGWFRIKIKIDSAFASMPLSFKVGSWAATDLYVDGKLIASFGNTGRDGAPYQEHRFIGMLPIVPAALKAGNEYIIALHFVDYLSTFPPFELKSSSVGLGNVISLVGPKYYSAEVRTLKMETFFAAIWTSVTIILSLLFWVLVIQNRKEKNILLFALCSTFEAIAIFCIVSASATGISFDANKLYNYPGGLFLILFLASMPVVIADIFKRKIFKSLQFILIMLIASWIISQIFPSTNDITGIIALCCYTSIIIFCIYYTVSSWKSLKGAQWAIVAGVLFTLVVILSILIIAFANPGGNINNNIFISGIILIFPISLWVYVIMRFREYINEVQINAARVLQMSEEKKEQALKQKEILQEEVSRQTAEIRSTLDNLKSTQHQLIQSEKMASLGELTAGIAHEIQNPLNFVNNFSEVNKELLSEMKDEMDKGNINDAKAIANDLMENEEKINHHGRRADAIVKNMLQHSRINTGQKELTDINALADEYLRLSYHACLSGRQGFRARDKSISEGMPLANATIKTDFDKSMDTINIIPQDIGRVLLNLYNNAFYAVGERMNLQSENYEPAISVSTKKMNDKIEIKVKDNGNGIAQNIVDKIFQPFFTTKPTGQGTGLGLSLSYDIIKAHGGEIKVETKEGEGSEFIIQLQISF